MTADEIPKPDYGEITIRIKGKRRGPVGAQLAEPEPDFSL